MRLIHWPYLVVQIFILVLLILILRVAGLVNPLPYIFGPVFFLVLAGSLRLGLGSDHQQGMRAIRRQQYHAAYDHFQNNVNYLEQRPWIDRYRAITLLSPSKMTYREMGLVNMAYCLAQMGRREEMEQLYRRVAAEYPNNEIAAAAVRMLDEQNG